LDRIPELLGEIELRAALRAVQIVLTGFAAPSPSLCASQADGHDQLPPVTRASDFAARVDISARDGDPHAAHRADQPPVLTERFDVLDFNEVVIVHGTSMHSTTVASAPPAGL